MTTISHANADLVAFRCQARYQAASEIFKFRYGAWAKLLQANRHQAAASMGQSGRFYDYSARSSRHGGEGAILGHLGQFE